MQGNGSDQGTHGGRVRDCGKTVRAGLSHTTRVYTSISPSDKLSFVPLIHTSHTSPHLGCDQLQSYASYPYSTPATHLCTWSALSCRSYASYPYFTPPTYIHTCSHL